MSAEKAGKKASVAGLLGILANPIAKEAMSAALNETERRIAEEELAERNYEMLLVVVLRIARDNGLMTEDGGGSCILHLKDDPKFENERWVVEAQPIGTSKVFRRKLSVSQYIKSSTFCGRQSLKSRLY